MQTRVVNLRREAFDVRIDRQTKLGNPYIIGKHGTREEVIAKHLALWRGFLERADMRDSVIATLNSLTGKRLGCHCAPLACHGDNYVKLIAEFC